MITIDKWKTIDIICFLNSYSRIVDVSPSVAIAYEHLYDSALDEFKKRSKLMAMIYR